MLARAADADARDRSRGDDAGWVLDCCALLEEGGESVPSLLVWALPKKRMMMRRAERGPHFWAAKKTAFTLRSMTFEKLESVWSSNFAPQVAPAFAKRMSTWSVVFSTSLTRRSRSAVLLLSQGAE